MRQYDTYNPININMEKLFIDVFTEGIPNNAYIDKSKTGLGLTYSEFKADRSSIIVVPTITIIEDKANSHASKKPFKLYHGFDEDSLKKYLKNSDVSYKKIVTTPDSFGKLMNAIESEGMLNEVLTKYFCFLDEVHCYVTEFFRGLILSPFNWFWEFSNKAVGSATPYHFSDTNFHKLDYFKLNFNEKFGTITLIEHEDTVEALAYLLSDLTKFDGNIHIFLNSVKLINRVINKAQLKDVAVFCADEDRNSDSLGENGIYFKEKPETGEYKKVNIYTAKYNEGWDLVDNEKCTFILVTDVGYRHSLVPVQFKGFQAVGRLRSGEKVNGRPKIIKPQAIYHITNTIPITQQRRIKDFDTVEDEWCFEALEHVAYYNSFNKKCKDEERKSKGIVNKLIEPFADIKDGKAIVVPLKIDQNVYEEYYKQFYYSGYNVKQAWEDMNYEVEMKLLPENITVIGEARSSVYRRIIAELEKVRLNPEQYDERTCNAIFRKLKASHGELFLSYNALGAQRLDDLGYDLDAMKKERLRLSNEKLFELIRAELIDELSVNKGKHPRPEIRQLLQVKYRLHGVYGSRNKIKIAKVSDLKTYMDIDFNETGKTTFKDKPCPAIVFKWNENDVKS